MSDPRIQNSYPQNYLSDSTNDPNSVTWEEQIDQGYSEDEDSAVLGNEEGFGDGYIPAEEGTTAGPIATYEEALVRLEDLLAQANSDSSLKDLATQIEQLRDQIKDKSGKIPQDVVNKIHSYEAQVFSNYGGGEGDESADLKKQADDLKKKIDASPAPEDKKQELKGKVDALLNVKGDEFPDFTLEDIQQEVELYGKYPEAAIRLAQAVSGGEPTEDGASTQGLPGEPTIKNLVELAGKHNVDLASVPNPPTKEFLEFLKEANPDGFGAAAEESKQTAEKRTAEDQTDANACHSINETRSAVTTGAVEESGTDVKMFQNRYDRKYYQDATSKSLAESWQSGVKSLIPLLQAAYGPSVEIKTVEPEAGTGWQLAYNKAMAADKISIGGAVIDLFNNTDGSLQAATEADQETLQIEAVKYDNEGNCQWMPSGNGYGEEFKKESYDDDTSTWDDMKTGAKWGAIVGGAAGIVGGPVGVVVGAAAGGVVGGAIGGLGDAVGLW